jgi:Xaa-Pro aminopeptidase
MYCADITRTWPISGRFSGAQRAVYELVLAAEEAALAVVAPGTSVAGVHDAAVRTLTEGLVDLGLLNGDVAGLIESGAYKRFYLHQTSHWLGLDVHDVGAYRDASGPVVLEPGMVLTVEPGLYIPDDDDIPEHFRGIAVRIEDDALVTVEGREILTRGVPVAPEEVEALARTREPE